MAGAKPGVHVVQLKPVQVTDTLIKGNKFVKWDDDSTMGTPVTLKVDPKGYILYWQDQHKESGPEMDCLDIQLIRDVRNGRSARVPRDTRVRDTVNMGSPDIPLEDKTITICYGSDSMVNLSWLNFAATSKEVAKDWAEELFTYATNLMSLNGSPLYFLEKTYTKLAYVLNTTGKIPVRKIYTMFSQHKDDRKRVERALEAARLPTGRNDQINPSKFTFEDFMAFYRHLVHRQEVEKVFHGLGAKKKPYLNVEQFRDFLNDQQRDPRLNEILYPFYDVKRSQAIIETYEPNRSMGGKGSETPSGHISQDGFLRFLMSEENALIPPEKYDQSEDMSQPLAHYFINSSHNTYLSGHQFTGKSSVELYRQVLLAGCRCVELDCWDGKGADEEPIITHGFTMCTEISFKEVIEAIAETAFKVSDYPVILSFENHCSPKQQAKMASHCRTILGDAILADPIESHPLEPNIPLPSPAQLKRKVIIKNKKRHSHKSKPKPPDGEADKLPGDDTEGPQLNEDGEPATDPQESGDADPNDITMSGPRLTTCNSLEQDDSDTASDTDDEEEENEALKLRKDEKGTAGQEAEAGMEMSALVNYIQPTHFHTFDVADKRNRSYECTSFVESGATALLKEFPVEFVNFNKRQLSRIYPKGTRVDSSNYMPQIFWNAGCQLVALNFQTLDLALMLNHGIFEYNGRAGYILKPDFMRRGDRTFDPFAESTVDGIIAGTVEIKVLSGQFLTDRKCSVNVEVEMYGLPADTVRRKFKTKTIAGNSINPVFDQEPFIFKKVVLPKLATLRIVCSDENGRLLGHRVLPVEGLRPGYRHISLRNELNQPQGLATIFVHLSVRDYVPDAFADFAAALVNPIAYQSALEKHSEQLAVLEEDFAAPDEIEAQELEIDKGKSNFDRKKNASVISKKSTGSDHTPSLSRGGSIHKPLNKQESSVSHGSVGSAGPGKCISVPSSPMHKLTEAQPADNGALRPSTSPKIDVSATTRLKDPDVLEPASISQLRELKQYVKLVQKRDKEIDTLSRKHEKSRHSMQELHELQEEKLLLSQIKNKTTIEKVHRKSIKRASKRGNEGEIDQKNKQELSHIVVEQQLKHHDLKHAQTDAMYELCHNRLESDLDLMLKYHPQLYDLLRSLMETSQEQQLKKLMDIHDKEVVELKKKLDAQSRDEMKQLAKKHKDKFELQRIKREAQQKHIQIAVQERQKLRDLVDKRKEEVKEQHEHLQQELETERKKIREQIEKEHMDKCAALDEEFKSAREAQPPKPSSEESDKQPSNGRTDSNKQGTTANGEDSSINCDSPVKHNGDKSLKQQASCDSADKPLEGQEDLDTTTYQDDLV